MQISERMLEKFNSVDSLIIKNISDLNEKVDVQMDILTGLSQNQFWTHFTNWGVIILAIIVVILIYKYK